MDDKLILELTKAEALVLFELLSREKTKPTIAIEDQSEQPVLWDIRCILEEQLVAPLDPNYHELLAKARQEVRDKDS